MLGDQIAEETGKVASLRVVDAASAKVEVSIHTRGKVLGNDYQGRATYTSEVQPGGFLFGQGQGIYMGEGGIATWKGQGTGTFNPGGGVSYRGSIHFITGTGKFASVAGRIGVFEHSTDANDNVTSKMWEWK